MATSIASHSAAECTSCSKCFKDPRMLPCLHTFCLQCIERISQQGAPKCPTCSEEIKLPEGGIEKLPFDLRKAYEALYDKKLDGGNKACDVCVRTEDAVRAFCVNCCEFLCSSCEAHHHFARKTKEHEVVQVDKLKKEEKSIFASPQLCTIHSNKVLEFYCERCDKLICHDCIELSHSKHRGECGQVEVIAARAMEHLRSCSEASPSDPVVKDAVSECEDAIQGIDSRKKEVNNTISKNLDQIRDTLLARNEEIHKEKTTHLQMQIERLNKVGDDLKYAVNMITQAESHTPAQQLATKKVIAERVAKLTKQYHCEHAPLESAHFLTKVTDNNFVGEMIDLCKISGGSDAASSTCDAGFVARAVVGKERVIKVTVRNKENELFPYGDETVTAKLTSNEHCIHGITTDHGDGTYSVSFIAKSAGVHSLDVEIGGGPIRGSPFVMTVRQPRTTPYSALTLQKTITTKNRRPYDIAFTKDGTLAVAEYDYHTVSLYSVMDGKRLHTFGSNDGKSGAGDDQFYNPTSVAIYGDVMYVTDYGNQRVKKIRLSDKLTVEIFGKGENQFSSPSCICIDPEGKLFIADSSNDRIQVLQPDGTFVHTITGDPQNKESMFKSPWGVAFDPQGHLHIAANGSNSIKVYTPEGAYVKSYGGDTVKKPAGIAIDEEGYVAISRYGNNHTVWIYSPRHTEPPVKTIRNFKYPVGIACDAEGTFWIADSSNNRVIQY